MIAWCFDKFGCWVFLGPKVLHSGQFCCSCWWQIPRLQMWMNCNHTGNNFVRNAELLLISFKGVEEFPNVLYTSVVAGKQTVDSRDTGRRCFQKGNWYHRRHQQRKKCCTHIILRFSQMQAPQLTDWRQSIHHLDGNRDALETDNGGMDLERCHEPWVFCCRCFEPTVFFHQVQNTLNLTMIVSSLNCFQVIKKPIRVWEILSTCEDRL